MCQRREEGLEIQIIHNLLWLLTLREQHLSQLSLLSPQTKNWVKKVKKIHFMISRMLNSHKTINTILYILTGFFAISLIFYYVLSDK